MGASERARRWLTGGAVLTAGVALTSVHLYHSTLAGETVVTFVLGILVPLVLSLLLVVAGVWLLDGNAVEDRHVDTVGAWCLTGVVGFFLVSQLLVHYQRAEGGALSDPLFTVATDVTIGAVVGVVVGVYDARSKDRAVALQAERDRIDFLNRVLRHNVLNAMNVVQGQVALLAEGADGDRRERVAAIQRRSDEVVAHVEEIRSFVDLVEETPTDDLEAVDLAGTLADEVRAARESYDGVSWDVPEDVADRDLRVRADDLLDEVFEHLLRNAVEHNDADEPAVSVAVRESDDRVSVSVADNGPGVPDDEKDGIFERAGADPGTGFGLYVVASVVAQYGGSVRVEDNDPEGAVFTVELPKA